MDQKPARSVSTHDSAADQPAQSLQTKRKRGDARLEYHDQRKPTIRKFPKLHLADDDEDGQKDEVNTVSAPIFDIAAQPVAVHICTSTAGRDHAIPGFKILRTAFGDVDTNSKLLTYIQSRQARAVVGVLVNTYGFDLNDPGRCQISFTDSSTVRRTVPLRFYTAVDADYDTKNARMSTMANWKDQVTKGTLGMAPRCSCLDCNLGRHANGHGVVITQILKIPDGTNQMFDKCKEVHRRLLSAEAGIKVAKAETKAQARIVADLDNELMESAAKIQDLEAQNSKFEEEVEDLKDEIWRLKRFQNEGDDGGRRRGESEVGSDGEEGYEWVGESDD